MKVIDLSEAGMGNFKRKKNKFIEAIWVLVEFIFITNPLQPSSSLRATVLRCFGAHIGKNVILRPRLRIKFPWNLKVGDNSWIGEGVWIHNQAEVLIEENVVVSQDTFITTGSHNLYKKMDLCVKSVLVRKGAWLTSRCIVTLGVEIGENTVVTPGSVVHKSLEANKIYGGNPLKFIKLRSNQTYPFGQVF